MIHFNAQKQTNYFLLPILNNLSSFIFVRITVLQILDPFNKQRRTPQAVAYNVPNRE